jgi:hypothetical protein
MQEAPATQYIFSDDNPIYHLALNENLSLCGLWLSTNREHRKRKDDRRLSPEKPTREFTALCSECDRKSKGLPKPKPVALDLLPRFRPRDVIVP